MVKQFHIVLFFKELDQEIDLISKNLSLANKTNSLSGVEYEKHCKEILEQAGWEVEETPAINHQGVDLIMSHVGS